MLTRSVRDCAALLDVVSGAMPGDPYSAAPPSRPYVQELGAPPGKLRIGVMRHAPRATELDLECLAAVDAMAQTLESLGHTLVEAYPRAFDEPEAGMHWFTVVSVNVARSLVVLGQKIGRELTAEDVEPMTWTIAEGARALPAPQWLATVEYIHAFGRRMRSFWEADGYDLLLSPVQAVTPPELGYISSTPDEPLRALMRSPRMGMFTLPMNLSGQPALALPTRMTPAGLPLGTQLTAAYGREDLLLRVASQVEVARPWHEEKPAIFG
jgi:amidase